MRKYLIIILLSVTYFTTNAQDTNPPSGLRWYGGNLMLRLADTSVYAHYRTAPGVYKFLRLPRYREFKPLTALNNSLILSGIYNGLTPQTISLNVNNSNNWLAKQTITLNSSQLRLAYDSNNYADFSVSNIGNVSITPVGTGGPLTTRSISLNGFNFTCGNEESNIEVPSAQSTDNTNNPLYMLSGGGTSVSYRTAFGGSVNSIVGINTNYSTVIFKRTNVTESNTGGTNHPLFANVAINPLIITNGVATLTNSASLFVNGAASNAINNYSIYSIGLNRLDTIKTNRLLLNGSLGIAGQIPRIKSDGSAMEWFTPLSDQQNYFSHYYASGNGSMMTINIPHGLSGITTNSLIWVTPKNSQSGGYNFITIDATNISITYNTAPPSGTNNLSFDIQIKP